MGRYSEAVDDLYDTGQQSQIHAVTSLDDDPEQAARAVVLGKDMGLDSSIVHGDLEGFEANHKAQLASQLIQGNSHLSDYIASHPMAAKVSNDDWANLDAFSQSIQKLGPVSMMQKAIEGFKEGWGPGGFRGLEDRPEDKAFAEAHPLFYDFIKRGAETVFGEPIELMSRGFAGALGALRQGGEESLAQLGVDRNEAKRAMRDVTAAVEMQLTTQPHGPFGKLHTAEAGAKDLPKPTPPEIDPKSLEAAQVALPYIKAGQEPPVGLHPLIDEMHIKQSEADLKGLDEATKLAQKTSTRERAPEFLENFASLRQQGSIGISAEAIAELYKDKMPTADDGLLGWVPDLEKKMVGALSSGGDIEIPLAGWLAKIEPEVAKQLHDHIRVRKGGVTKAEGEVLKQQLMVDAYHGSPHEFDAFSMEKIGTGEGAQAYGYGLYFAENKAVAADYAKKLDLRSLQIQDHNKIQAMKARGVPDAEIIKALEANGNIYAEMEVAKYNHAYKGGNEYRVRIHADKEQFLDWDKALSEQTSEIQQALKSLQGKLNLDPALFEEGNRASTGQHFHLDLAQALRESDVNMSPKDIQAEVSKVLHKEGIPGIKYLDQGSRLGPDHAQIKIELDRMIKALERAEEDLRKGKVGAEDQVAVLEEGIIERKELLKQGQTYNYVVFDASLIEITHRNDQALASVRKAAGLETKLDRARGTDFETIEPVEREGEWIPIGKEVEGFVPEKMSAFEEAASKLVEEELARIVPKKVGVETASNVRSKKSKVEHGGVYSQFDDRLPSITIALANQIDIVGIGRHEAIHHLRAYGFFTDAEWATLEKAAKEESWLDKNRLPVSGGSVADKYPGLKGERLLEEAIADEFRYWNRNTDHPTLAAAVFAKLKKFLDAVKAKWDSLMSKDPDVAQIFKMIESGEIGRREGTKPRHPHAFDQFAEGKQGELDVTRQEDKRLFATIPNWLNKSQYDRWMELIKKQDAEDAEWKLKLGERLERKKQSAEWKELSAEVRKEVEGNIEQRPDLAAMDFFRSGKLYGEETGTRPRIDPSQLTPEQRKAFPEKYQRRDGMAPQDVANLFGYPTVDDLLANVARVDQEIGTKSYPEHVQRLIASETERLMEQRHGNLEENILREAQEHVISETQMDLLHERVVGLGMKAGSEMSFTKADFKAWVKDWFKDQPAKGISVEGFLRQMGTIGRNIQDLESKGEWAEAFKLQQTQLMALMAADEAKRFEKAKKTFERTMDRFEEPEPKGIAPEHTNYIHQIMQKIGYPVKRSEAHVQAGIDSHGYGSLEDFYRHRNTFGLPLLEEIMDYNVDYTPTMPVADFLFDPAFRKDAGKMNVGEFTGVMDSVKSLVKNGRNEARYIREGDASDLAQLKEEMTATLRELGEKPIYRPEHAGPLGKAKHLLGRGLAGLLQMEALWDRFDHGDPKGIFTRNFGLPFARAGNEYARLQREYSGYLREIDKFNKKLKEGVSNSPIIDPLTKDFDPSPMRMTRENLRAVILNMGNRSNFEKMAKGFDVEPANLEAWVHANATKEDWDYAQAMWNIFKKVKSAEDKMTMELSGTTIEDLPIEPIQTLQGEYEGGYFPMRYDRTRGAGPKEELKKIDFLRPMTNKGWEQKRTGYVGPVDLTLGSIPQEILRRLKDLAFRQPIMEASKIMLDKNFKMAVTRYYGQPYADLMLPYLQDMAGQAGMTAAHMQAWERVAENIRQNTIGTLVGYNPGTVIKHGLSAWSNSMAEVGVLSFLDHFGKTWLDPKMENYKFVMEGGQIGRLAWKGSEEVQRRMQHFEETLGGAHDMIMGTPTIRQRALQWGSKPVAISDLASTIPTWLAQYETTMREIGASKTTEVAHTEAVAMADRAVRNAHGSTAITSRPAFMRGGTMSRGVTSLYGFFNHVFNRYYQMAWRSKEFANEPSVAEFRDLSNRFLLYMVGPILAEGVAELGLKKDESWPAWLWHSAIHTASGTIPILRDIVHAGLGGRDPSTGIWSASEKAITDTVRAFEKKKADPGAVIQAGVTLAGVATGVGSAQVGRWAKFGYNYAQRKERPQGPGDTYRGFRRGTTQRYK